MTSRNPMLEPGASLRRKLRNSDPDLWVETRRNDRIVKVELRGLMVTRGDSKTRCATPRTSSKTENAI